MILPGHDHSFDTKQKTKKMHPAARISDALVTFCVCFKVVLKIIKHCQDERSAGEVVQGVLLGLIQNNKLEITNCFPFPSSRAGDDDDEDDGERISK